MPNFEGFNISKYILSLCKKKNTIFQVWLSMNHHINVYVPNFSCKKGFLSAAFRSLPLWNYFYIQAKQKHFGAYLDMLSIDGSSPCESKVYCLTGCSVHSNSHVCGYLMSNYTIYDNDNCF